MKPNKQKKTEDIIKILQNRNHYVQVYDNGHIKVLDINFWCTSEKWHDPKRKIKGLGLSSFIKYIEDGEI